ncbi:MAG: type II secretion system protein GspD [Planctomycetota bacterium]|jgi:general secretion pathway protein D
MTATIRTFAVRGFATHLAFAVALVAGHGGAQEQEPSPAPGASAAPRGQDPVPAPSTTGQPAAAVVQDPTRPDAELLRRLGMPGGSAVGGGGALPLLRPPQVALKAVLAADPAQVRVLLDVGGVLVAAVPGSSFVAEGRTVRVEPLAGGELRLRVDGLEQALVLPLGLPPATAAPAAGAPTAAANANAPVRELRLARVDLRTVPLEQAARLLADLSGVNVAVSALAAALPVSVYLSDVEPLVAVRTICESHQLWWRRDAATGIVRVGTAGEYQRDLAELQEERTEAFTLHYPNVFDVGRAVRELYGDRVVIRQQLLQDESLIELANRLSRFDLFDGRQQGFGQGFNGNGQQNGAFGQQGAFGAGLGGGLGAGFGGGLGGGLGFGQVDGGVGAFGNGQLGQNGFGSQLELLRAQNWTAAEIQRLEQAIERLQAGGDAGAQKDVQREVAGRTRSPIFVTIAPRQNKVLVRTRDTAALEQIRGLVQSLDVPTALVLLEVRVLGIDDLDGFESFFEYQGADGSIAGQVTTGNIQRAPAGTPGPGGTGLRSGDLIFQYVDATFGARLQMLERDNRVHSLATPILLTANNEVSRLFVGKEVPINRSFVGGQINLNQATATTTTGTTSIEFRPVGTTLLMTPSINADRTVTLKIVQEQSNADGTATVLVPSGTGFQTQTVNIVSSQTVSGTIVAKSDLAVAFGGLVETSESLVSEKVPLLGDIPVLGLLFRRDVERKTRREIVIVVKPYVIGTPSEQVGRSRSVLRELGVDLEQLEPRLPEGEQRAPADTLFGPGGAPSKPRFRVHGVDAPDGGPK